MCFQSSTMEAVSFMNADDQNLHSFDQTTAQFLLSPLDITNRRSTKCCDKEAAKRCKLVDYDCLPEFLKDNEFIFRHYRSEWPLRQTVLSIFSIHNETLNVWTHLIGFFIFLALFVCAASVFPPTIGSTDADPLFQLSNAGNSSSIFYSPSLTTDPGSPIYSHSSSVSRWPFYLFLAGAMFCLLMSCACHLLSCHSSRTCYVMLRLDFAGISGLIVSSFYPLVYYTFACDTFFRNLYLGSITTFGLAVVIVSLVPAFDSPQFRPVRAVLFACMAASGVVPIAHKIIAFGNREEAMLTTGYEAVMGLLYGLGVVVYAARVPERWLPGKFDLAGHSHQLFHVLVVAGAYTHYLSSSVYLAWREAEGC